MNRHVAFLSIVGAVFAGLALVFVTFPRSTYSELEKRDLAPLHPELSHAMSPPGSVTASRFVIIS